MRRTEAADKLWEREYYRRAEYRVDGAVARAILARGDAQLVRLSMLAALCRGESWIDEVDLAAALDLWQYCEASVRLFFASGEDPVVSKIVAAVRESPGISRRTLRRSVAKTMDAEAFVAKLAQAAATGAIVQEVVETGGRPRECWFPRVIERPEAKRVKRAKSPPSSPGSDPFGPYGPYGPASATEKPEPETTQTPKTGGLQDLPTLQASQGSKSPQASQATTIETPAPSSSSKHGRTL
jgi:hypothetical protein